MMNENELKQDKIEEKDMDTKPDTELSEEEIKRKQAARSWLAQYIESIRAGIK